MPKFIPYNHNQNAMVVTNFRDQLQPGTFEHAIHYLIHEKLDLPFSITPTTIKMAVGLRITRLFY